MQNYVPRRVPCVLYCSLYQHLTQININLNHIDVSIMWLIHHENEFRLLHQHHVNAICLTYYNATVHQILLEVCQKYTDYFKACYYYLVPAYSSS